MDAVTLVWRAKTPEGWKRFQVVMGRNGRIKKGAVTVDGKERNYAVGYFQLRYYEHRQTKFCSVGTDTTEEVNECNRQQNLSDARTSAEAAGVTVNERTTRKTIKTEASRFDKAAKDRDAMEAAKVNASAMLEFQQDNEKLAYVDEINAAAVMAFRHFLKKKGNSARTISNKYQRITGFLGFCHVDYKSWEMKPPKYEKKLPDVYTKEDIDNLLSACKREYNRVLIHILKGAGLRDGEIQHLQWNDIRLPR